MKIISEYLNGNYQVTVYSDGTKVRKSNVGNNLKPQFPESIDLKITNQCSIGCSFCAENSTPNGKHGEFKSENFQGLPKIELAIGGGDPLAYPRIENILSYLSEKFICNITVNGKSLCDNYYLEKLQSYITKKYIHGVGISYSDDMPNIEIKNSVVHCIAGIHAFEQIRECAKTNKVLILGFKTRGRGEKVNKETVCSNQLGLRGNLYDILGKYHLAFDNLAVEQLQLKEFVTGSAWKNLYMGEDGKFSMYYDMVEGKYKTSSNATIYTPDNMSIKNFFHLIQNNSEA